MKPNRHALIFSTVWPEPESSAAGVRQMHWVGLLLKEFEKVTLISPAKEKGEQDWGKVTLPPGVQFLSMPLNRWDCVSQLREMDPELVMFDRFILEEQFGALVYEALPEALILLETQDLHLVRRARESLRESWLTSDLSDRIYQTETALRETASIERVDYSFVVSSFEEDLLKREFDLGESVQSWIPFFYDLPIVDQSGMPFSERDGFVWIGNFRHAPNADGLRWLRREIWPFIQRFMPSAKLRVYGAYPSEEFMSWNRDQNSGIEVIGAARNLDEVFLKARVNLASLRFGAGVKGKILEGFRYGVPVVTTRVGKEGILPLRGVVPKFPGLVCDDAGSFAQAAVELYQNEQEWVGYQEAAFRLMRGIYDRKIAEEKVGQLLQNLRTLKAQKKLPRWRSRMLRHELFNSHKYFSKWIECKELKLSRAQEDRT